MKQARILISGFVHGVGFRYSVKEKAQAFGVTGWVKNTFDGNVEAVFQGSKVNVEKTIAACKEGPPMAAVKEVKIFWEEPKEVFESFEIV